MEASSVRYASINDAIRIIRGCALAKTDVKNAFRLIPVNPNDYDLLGIFWQDHFYYDKSLPMGCSSSCKIFEAFSSTLEWIARYKLSTLGILHILDDFLIIERDTVTCSTKLLLFLKTCDDLGVPMAPEKTSLKRPLVQVQFFLLRVSNLILSNWKRGFLRIR